jgi:hypothetical protein
MNLLELLTTPKRSVGLSGQTADRKVLIIVSWRFLKIKGTPHKLKVMRIFGSSGAVYLLGLLNFNIVVRVKLRPSY